MPYSHIIGDPNAATDQREPLSAEDLARQVHDLLAANPAPAAIIISGLLVTGDIDLAGLGSGAATMPTLEFRRCTLDRINLEGSSWRGLLLTDCELEHLFGRRLEVRSALTFQRVTVRDTPGRAVGIDLYQAIVRGDIYWSHFASASTGPQTLILSEMTVEGRLQLLHGAIASGILLENARLGSLLVLDTAVAGALKAQNLSVASTVLLQQSTIGDGDDSFASHGCEVGGAFMLSGAKLKGKFRLYAARIGINLEFKDGTVCDADGEGICLDLSSATIGNSLLIQSRSSFLGTIQVHYATVNGLLEVADAFLNTNNSETPSLSFSDSRMGSLSIARSTFNADLMLANVTTTGNVTLWNLQHRFDADEAAQRQSQFASEVVRRIDLSGARIGGKIAIDDSLLQTATRDTPGPALAPLPAFTPNAGAPRYNARPSIQLILDGASADVIDLPPTNPASMMVMSWAGFSANRVMIASSEDALRIVDRLKRDALYWAAQRRQLQVQPFIHFAQHLRAAGWQDEADRLLIQMKRVQRRMQGGFVKIWSYLFDALFRFGFGKTQSAATLLLWILVGTIGADVAIKSDALVLSTQAVLPAVSVSQLGGDVAPAPLMIYGRPAPYSELPCHGEIVPVYYAVELILPIFDLGQRGKCDLRGLDKIKDWPSDPAFWWWFAKYLYVMTGWVIVSMTLLTFLGTMKSRAYGSL